MTQLTITNCEKEQIHIPGLIQNFGLLVCVDTAELRIEQISENVEFFLGKSASSLLGESLTSLISLKEFEAVQTRLLLKKEDLPFRIPLTLKKFDETTESWMGFIHRHEKQFIIELERAVDVGGEPFFIKIENSISEIQSANSLRVLCEVSTREIQRLTEYDRVMIYRFDPDWNGEVIAESRSSHGLESFLGHRFPGSDIPPQARAVFLSNWIRMISDVDYVPVPIVPVLHHATGLPLNLGQAFLRAVSPIHIQYLKNMNVGGTLTISLIKDGSLWGLISCHHNTPKFINYDMRASCQFIGKLVSSQLGYKERITDTLELQRLQTIQSSLIKSMNREDDPVKGLLSDSSNLLGVVGSKDVSACIRIDGEWVLLGKTPTPTQIDRLVDWLQLHMTSTEEHAFHTDHLSSLFPEAESYCDVASGLLAVSIPKTDKNFIIWFRPEVLQTVTWAGNPKKHVEKLADGTFKIEPRLSFEAWKETVTSRSLPWRSVEIKAALELRNSILSIDLRRQFRLEQEARAEAERMSKEKGDVLSTVSHDLKNPLFSIDLIMEWFDKRYQHSDFSSLKSQAVLEDTRNVLSKIKVSTKRMQRLIEDLLDVAKIEGGTFSLDSKSKDVTIVIIDAVKLLTPHAQVKNITLETRTPPSCRRMVDEDRLVQVLSNLIGNSIKFTPSGGLITVSLDGRENDILVTVRDTGGGISPDHLPHVFDRFWQVLATRKMGTGLGLAICKGIVDTFGGKIWIESKLCEGTTVSFTLPIVVQSHQAPLHQVEKRDEKVVPMKILLVEDDASIRSTLRELLEMEGYQCKEAVDGLEAKEILEQDKSFELLISDFRMPRWDGVQLLEWCRLNNIHVPVIFITANADLFTREKLALQDCCAALLKKPVSLDDLLKEVELARIRKHHRDC